jgi:transposase
MDLHLKTSVLSILDEEGEVTIKTICTRRGSLTRAFVSLLPCKVLIEASTESEWVARHLEELGAEVIVASPSYEPMYAFRDPHIKTDRRDAEALMHACIRGQYRRSYRCTDARRRLQMVLTVRGTLVGSRTKMISVVRALLRSRGIRVPSGSTRTFVSRVERLALDDELQVTLGPLLASLKLLTEQIASIDAQMQALSREDREIERLQQVPGVGPIVAATFVASLDDPSRFSSASALTNFLGLTPRERSSSEQRRRGRITKRGPSELRRVLVQAAWVIWKSASPSVATLREWVHRLASRRGRQVAIVALARRLARILWALWAHQSTFDPQRLQRAGYSA